MECAPIRVLVVDDHPAVRRSLGGLLEDQEDFEVAETLASPQAALSLARCQAIDVAVIDYQLDGPHNGLWLSRRLKRLPEPPSVLIYSAYCDRLLAAASVVAEADGILTKGGPGSQLCHAIRCVSRRRLPLPVAPRLLEQTLRERLDDEQQVIFGMLLGGLSPAEIAEVLGWRRGRLESCLSAMLSRLESISRPPPLAEHPLRTGVAGARPDRSALNGRRLRPGPAPLRLRSSP